jgi:hypothetical protein
VEKVQPLEVGDAFKRDEGRLDAVWRWRSKYVVRLSRHSIPLTIVTVCIGLHLAQMELRIATAKFFRAFPNAKVSTLEGFSDDDMEQMIYFLMYPKNKRCLIQAS